MSKTIFKEDTFDPREKPNSELDSQTIVDIEKLNITITNSYHFNSKQMNDILDYIMNKDYFRMLAAAGFTRSKESLLREWKAHNILYRWGYEKERTGSVDFSQYESRIRRIGYLILSILYKD
jgi:hypothetical protein